MRYRARRQRLLKTLAQEPYYTERMKPRKKRESAAFNPIDIHVGKRIRIRRRLLGLSQTAVADKLGLTFQQQQKYERGANRVSASKLFAISQVLDVPVSFFFDDLTAETADRQASIPTDPFEHQEVRSLLVAYFSIEDPAVRSALFQLAKAMAWSSNGEAI